jgi:hypothetical protein
MELTLVQEPPVKAEPQPAKPKSKRANVKHPRPRLLTLSQLDRRTNAARFLAALIDSVEQELGGHDQIDIATRHNVEGYCSTVLLLKNLNTRLVQGEQIDFDTHARACRTMMDFASCLGLKGTQQQKEGANE